MSNTHLYGFRYFGSRSGASQPKPIPMPVASGYQATANSNNVNLNPGDPVTLLSTGYIQLAAAGGGAAIYGVVAGIQPFYDGTRMKYGSYLPGGTTYGTVFERQSFVLVHPVIDAYFEIDCDDAVTATTYATYLALMGSNCDHALPSNTGNSSADPLLDISTTNTTNTLQWRLERISPRIDQDFSSTYVKLIVSCNVVQEAPFQTTGL